jgi:hypothetical protein
MEINNQTFEKDNLMQNELVPEGAKIALVELLESGKSLVDIISEVKWVHPAQARKGDWMRGSEGFRSIAYCLGPGNGELIFKGFDIPNGKDLGAGDMTKKLDRKVPEIPFSIPYEAALYELEQMQIHQEEVFHVMSYMFGPEVAKGKVVKVSPTPLYIERIERVKGKDVYEYMDSEEYIPIPEKVELGYKGYKLGSVFKEIGLKPSGIVYFSPYSNSRMSSIFEGLVDNSVWSSMGLSAKVIAGKLQNKKKSDFSPLDAANMNMITFYGGMPQDERPFEQIEKVREWRIKTLLTEASKFEELPQYLDNQSHYKNAKSYKQLLGKLWEDGYGKDVLTNYLNKVAINLAVVHGTGRSTSGSAFQGNVFSPRNITISGIPMDWGDAEGIGGIEPTEKHESVNEAKQEAIFQEYSEAMYTLSYLQEYFTKNYSGKSNPLVKLGDSRAEAEDIIRSKFIMGKKFLNTLGFNNPQKEFNFVNENGIVGIAFLQLYVAHIINEVYEVHPSEMEYFKVLQSQSVKEQ